MREFVVISGKGGTGKTSITAALAFYANKKHTAIFADCDVDAADLHLIFNPEIKERREFKSGHEAMINKSKCNSCGKCKDLCRFNAILFSKADGHEIDAMRCEGCGVCVDLCPEEAIDFIDKKCGEWFVSVTRFGTFVHARLEPQAENSGKLVSLVRQKAREYGIRENADFLIIDGAPGIGCPVIASITGVDAVLAVTEPTMSAKHDLERVIQLCIYFGVKIFVCINKWDINPMLSDAIEEECKKYNIQCIGKISYDPIVTEAQVNGVSVSEFKENRVSNQIYQMWEILCQKKL